ncbi:MAG: hypothetical protein IJC48_04895 [Clostridia bacterium]|nr:hypothetical protein [Clostridia bacterium]
MKTLEGAAFSLKAYIAGLIKPEKDQRELRLNQCTDILKILACAAMLLDHMGKMIFPEAYNFSVSGKWAYLFPSGNILRIIGRLAMPMFVYGVAVGSAYTKNTLKYVLRLLLVGVLVHPLYMAAMGHVPIGGFDWAKNFYRLDLIFEHYYTAKLNIFFSLALGAAILSCVRAKAYVPMVLFCLAAWCVQGKLDYGIKGIMLMALFYALFDRPLASFLAVFLFMWYWGMPNFFTSGNARSTSQLYAVYSLILIYLPVKKRIKLPKALFYGFYPAHLLLIYLLQL